VGSDSANPHSTAGNITPEGLPEEARQQVLAALERRLRSTGNPIAEDRHALTQLRAQLESILDELSGPPVTPRPALPTDAAALAAEIGVTRAARGVHPSDSLWAVTELFEVALPALVAGRSGAPADVDTAVQLATGLHRALMARVIRASVPYVDFLLSKVSSSQRDERARLGRELHDRAAHVVGVGLQSLELHRVYAATDPKRAGEKLDAAWQALHDAMQTIRELAGELRESVGSGGLPRALLGYLEANVPPDIEIGFATNGDMSTVPADVCDQFYLVLREAVRNAVLHGKPTSLRVRLEVAGGELTARVTDDGVGFDAPTTPGGSLPGGSLPGAGTGTAELAGGGVGIASMRERMQLLGGTLLLSSAAGGGTTVEARLSLVRPLP
jgi:signal transduction histidine kinase